MSASLLTTSQWLARATEKLKAAGIETARLDCLVLLEDVTNKDRAHLLAYPETILTDEQLKRLNALLKKRAKHYPLAYVRQKTEFYGREFAINHHVLEPRPESEALIDLLKHLPVPPDTTIADVGTGSGALAITAKLETRASSVVAMDIDPDCLALASRNAKKLRADILLLRGDLLTPLTGDQSPAIILANLPYVPETYSINQAAMEEPRLAIFGGQDGLDLYRRLFEQAARLPEKPWYILTESLPFQHQDLAAIARKHKYSQTQAEGFIQVFTSKESKK